MAVQVGIPLAEFLEGLALDVREQALQSELAREERRADRDWNAINAQLRRVMNRQGGIVPARDWCAGELKLRLVK